MEVEEGTTQKVIGLLGVVSWFFYRRALAKRDKAVAKSERDSERLAVLETQIANLKENMRELAPRVHFLYYRTQDVTHWADQFGAPGLVKPEDWAEELEAHKKTFQKRERKREEEKV